MHAPRKLEQAEYYTCHIDGKDLQSALYKPWLSRQRTFSLFPVLGVIEAIIVLMLIVRRH